MFGVVEVHCLYIIVLMNKMLVLDAQVGGTYYNLTPSLVM